MKSNIKKVMIIHTIAWSHYAGLVFSRLQNLLNDEKIDFSVIHIARNSKGRKLIGDFTEDLHKYSYKILYNGYSEDFRTLRKIRSILLEIYKYRPDLLITAGYNDFTIILGAILNKFLGSKNIVTSDTTIHDRKRVKHKEVIKKFILKFYDYAFCVGTEQKRYFESLGLDKDKIKITGWYAVDDRLIESTFNCFQKNGEELRKNYKSKNFIFVGRLSREKNVDMLIKAFASLKRKSIKAQNWGLIIVGDGPTRGEIEQLIRNLNLNDVYLTGGLLWRDVPKYYALSDVFVLPSLSEPWGLVVNEAMNCRLPVIVSKRAGSYYDLVREGENGFGFDPFNQVELEKVMFKFVNEEVDLKLMGDRSKEIIKNYSLECITTKMFENIKSIVKG